jgi:hypothetical protein
MLYLIWEEAGLHCRTVVLTSSLHNIIELGKMEI